MNLFFRELSGKINDDNGVKGAFLDADAAARAEILGYHCLSIFWPLDDALTASLVHWAVDDALKPALSWLAELFVKYRYPMSIFCFRIAQLRVNFAIIRYIDTDAGPGKFEMQG